MARINTLLLLIAGAPSLWAAHQGLFLDTSGSMMTYHADGTVATLTKPLHDALQSQGDLLIYGFAEQVQAYPALASITPAVVGGYTNLDKVVDRALADRLDLFWLVTDNLEQSPGSVEGAGTEHFYRKLRDPNVRRVTVFPIAVGPGKPGLIVYAVLLNPDDAPQYEQGIAGFQRSAHGMLQTDALLMKPLAGSISATVTAAAHPGGKEFYRTGKPIRKVIEVKFQSSLSHLAIKDSDIEIKQEEPKFQDNSLLAVDERKVQIRPNQITILPGGGETAQHYELTLELSPLRLKPGVATLWKAAFGKNSEEARLRTTLLIKVPGHNFRLHDDFLSRFHASTPQEAKATGKIYALDSLPADMSEDVTAIELEQETVFPVEYPFYPTLIWLLLAALLIAAVIAAVKFAPSWMPAGKSKWRVTVLGEGKMAAEIRNGKVTVDGTEVGSLEGEILTPGPQVAFSGGAAQAALAHGTIVEMRVGRQSLSLQFEQKGHKKAKVEAAPSREVTRRR